MKGEEVGNPTENAPKKNQQPGERTIISCHPLAWQEMLDLGPFVQGTETNTDHALLGDAHRHALF